MEQNMLLSIVAALGLPTIVLAVYRLFFYVDSDKSRRQINDMLIEQNKREIETLKQRMDKHSEHINSLYTAKTQAEKEFLAIKLTLESMQKEVGTVHLILNKISDKIDKISENQK